MKRFLLLILYSLIVTLGLGGCGSGKQEVTSQPEVIIETLYPGLEVFAPMWQKEINRRFHNAVGILVHGGDFEDNRWIVGSALQPQQHVSTAVDIVRHFQDKYPGRTIVLLACNTGHLKLGIRGVFYAQSSVWCVPDRAIDLPEVTPFQANQTLIFGLKAKAKADRIALLSNRWDTAPEVVGNIFEFVSE